MSREDGIRYAAECIQACIPHAAERGITLILENHYKDNYWKYPEFAQKMDVFCDLVDRDRLARTSASTTTRATRSSPAKIRWSCCGA